MIRMMILSKMDFDKDAQGQPIRTLVSSSEAVRKEEMRSDIVAYVDNGNLILLKNRAGPIGRFQISSEIADLLRAAL